MTSWAKQDPRAEAAPAPDSYPGPGALLGAICINSSDVYSDPSD